MIKDCEEIPKPLLIEDLGMLYPTETSKRKYRFGIYECGLCGKHFKARTANVKNGATKSCGCYQKSNIYRTSKANKATKHGGKGTKLYNTWINLKDRTLNLNTKFWDDYGGRGITICDEWKDDFTKFRDWSLANGYEEDKGLSIDRIDNDGNYEPSNCRWTTKTIQARNQRIRSTNTSGFRGVSFNKKYGKFIAYIKVDTVRIHLGYFSTALEGAIMYNTYIIENNLEGFNLNIII